MSKTSAPGHIIQGTFTGWCVACEKQTTSNSAINLAGYGQTPRYCVFCACSKALPVRMKFSEEESPNV